MMDLLINIFRLMPFAKKLQFIYEHPNCAQEFKDIMDEEFQLQTTEMKKKYLLSLNEIDDDIE